MPNTSNDTKMTKNDSQGHLKPSQRIRVTNWMPIPLEHNTRRLMNMRSYPDWNHGHMYKFTTNEERKHNSLWPSRVRYQIGYVWAGKGKIVLRWRGKSYHWDNDRPMWETVEHVISTVAG